MGRLTIEPRIFSGEIPPTKSVLHVLIERRFAIHFSCRRGLCGQDLIRVLSGSEHLNPICENELSTLEMLRVKDQPMRMACCTKVVGDGEVVVQIV